MILLLLPPSSLFSIIIVVVVVVVLIAVAILLVTILLEIVFIVTTTDVLGLVSLVDIVVTDAAIAAILRKSPAVVVALLIVIFATKIGHQTEAVAVAKWKARLRRLFGKISAIVRFPLPGPGHGTKHISVATRWLVLVARMTVVPTAAMGMLASELEVLVELLRPGADTTVIITIGALKLVSAAESFARVRKQLVNVVVALGVAAGHEPKAIASATAKAARDAALWWFI